MTEIKSTDIESEKLPFQVQKRIYSQSKIDNWILLSKSTNPKDDITARVPVIAIPSNKFSDFFACKSKRVVPVFKDSEATATNWDCNPNSWGKAIGCEVVSDGWYQKHKDKAEYKLNFRTGTEIDFTWSILPSNKKQHGFKPGIINVKSCETKAGFEPISKAVLEKDVPADERCYDIWDKEKRWKYYNTKIVRETMRKYIDDHAFRFTYVSTDAHNKVPEEIRKVDEGMGVWRRKWKGKTLSIPSHITADELADYLRSISSGMTEIHYEPSTDVVDGEVRRKKVSDIIIDMDVTKDFPFDKVTRVAQLTQKIAPKVVNRVWGVPKTDIRTQLVFTGKTSYHLHISVPKEYARLYGGVQNLEPSETVSGLICEIANEVNKVYRARYESKDDIIVCGEGHGNKIGFDFASCNAPGKNCIVPFSFRVPDVEKGIYSCRVAVPVDFKKIPDFNPKIHATADFVMQNQALFQ